MARDVKWIRLLVSPPEGSILDVYPEHQVPPPLAQFARDKTGLDYDPATNEIYLYHGTNCYRRWEINRTGAIETGRSNYSFFSTRAADAYMYARGACMRDISPGTINSLICEPVVLRVRFTARTWLQVDFMQSVGEDDEPLGWSAAVLGPVASSNIADVLHCGHGRRLSGGTESVRSFEDGTLMTGIRNLKEKLCAKRPDAWMLKNLGLMARTVGVRLKGGEMPEQTFEDNLKRLRQCQLKA